MLPHSHKVHEASSKSGSPKVQLLATACTPTELDGTEAVLQAVNECMLAVDCASTAESWNFA